MAASHEPCGSGVFPDAHHTLAMRQTPGFPECRTILQLHLKDGCDVPPGAEFRLRRGTHGTGLFFAWDNNNNLQEIGFRRTQNSIHIVHPNTQPTWTWTGNSNIQRLDPNERKNASRAHTGTNLDLDQEHLVGTMPCGHQSAASTSHPQCRGGVPEPGQGL